jgi:hypothetical protein
VNFWRIDYLWGVALSFAANEQDIHVSRGFVVLAESDIFL